MNSNPGPGGDSPIALPTSPRVIPAGKGERDWTMLACALLVLAVWVTCHSYSGIVHDNRIYALLAFNYTDPTAFAGDVFLKHGSQDSFTFFSPLYAWVIGLIGLEWGTKLLLIAGQALWILCALLLIRRMVAPRFVWLALLFLAAYPPFYGSHRIFSLAEGFLTPRIFAEAMGMAALAAFLGGRSWLAILPLAIGGLLHPLMIAAPAGVIVTMAILRHRPWWWTLPFVAAGSALLVFAIAAVHLLGLPLLPEIDAEWKFIVGLRTGQLLLAKWGSTAWLPIAADVIIVALACIKATPQVRQMLVAAVAVGLASAAVSFAAFDLLNDVTIGQAQVWRALWLLHALAPISLALVVQDIGARDVPERKLLLTLAFSFSIAAFLCLAASLPPLGISVAFLLAITYVSVLAKGTNARSWLRDIGAIWAGYGVLILVILGEMISEMRSGALALDAAFLQNLVTALMIALAGLLLFTQVMQRHRGLLALVLLATLCLFLTGWDARPPWRRYMDAAPDLAGEIPVSIAPGEVVYWPTDVMALWGALRRPSFYSDVQGAGVIFNRGTALDYVHRLGLVSRFEPNSRAVALLLRKKPPRAISAPAAEARLDDLIALCSNPDHPDVVVLTQNVPGAGGKSWKPPVPFTRTYITATRYGRFKPEDFVTKQFDEFFFYRCQDITQAGEGGVSGTTPGAG